MQPGQTRPVATANRQRQLRPHTWCLPQHQAPIRTAALYLGAVALAGQALNQVVQHPMRRVQAARQAQHIAVQRAHAVLRQGPGALQEM